MGAGVYGLSPPLSPDNSPVGGRGRAPYTPTPAYTPPGRTSPSRARLPHMTWPWRISSELRTISATLAQLTAKVNKIMADQDALNAIAQRIEADVTGEGAALQTIKDALAALQATASQGQPLDFTAINQAVTDLDGKLSDIQQVAASTQPAPPADQPPPATP